MAASCSDKGGLRERAFCSAEEGSSCALGALRELMGAELPLELEEEAEAEEEAEEAELAEEEEELRGLLGSTEHTAGSCQWGAAAGPRGAVSEDTETALPERGGRPEEREAEAAAVVGLHVVWSVKEPLEPAYIEGGG